MVKRTTPEAVEAVAGLFAEQSEAVFRVALLATSGDTSSAEELVQAAFVEAVLRWQSLKDFPQDRQRAWLRDLVRRKAVDGYRLKNLHPSTDPEFLSIAADVLPKVPSAEHSALSRIMVERLREIIGGMPQARRTVAYLSFFEEWTPQEIADHLGIKPSTVRSHLKMARDTLIGALTTSDVPPDVLLALTGGYRKGDVTTPAEPGAGGHGNITVQGGQGSGRGRSGNDATGGGAGAGRGGGVAAGEPPARFLTGRLPERAPAGRRISLIAQITVTCQGDATLLRPLDIPPEGRDITLTVSAPGLVPMGDLEQDLHLPAAGNSEPIRFGFMTGNSGLHSVTLSAFIGGTFLGELAMQVSVEVGASMEEGPSHHVVLAAMAAEPGEVTLQVSRTDDDRYSFQLIGEALYPVELTRRLAGDPGSVVGLLAQELRAMAAHESPYADPLLARNRLRNLGAQLWADVVPDAIRRCRHSRNSPGV